MRRRGKMSKIIHSEIESISLFLKCRYVTDVWKEALLSEEEEIWLDLEELETLLKERQENSDE